MGGKIDANDQANIASKISGKVSKVLVDIGSKVNVGDTVIQLDNRLKLIKHKQQSKYLRQI